MAMRQTIRLSQPQTERTQTRHRTRKRYSSNEANNVWVYEKALTTHRYFKNEQSMRLTEPEVLNAVYKAKTFFQSKSEQVQLILNLDYTNNHELIIHSYKDCSLILNKLRVNALPYEYTVNDFVIGVEPLLHLVENVIAKPNFALSSLADRYGLIQGSVKNNESELTYELLYMIQLDALTPVGGNGGLRTGVFIYYDTLLKNLTINVEELGVNQTVPVNLLSYELYAVIELAYEQKK